MPGVPTEFAEHKLHVRSDVKPVRQPLRRLSEEKRRVVGEEIARLLAAGFIMEVFFSGVASKPSPGAEEEQAVADVYRLHKSQ